MSWEELWAWYENTTKEVQEDILRQINLKEFLRRLTPKYQKEVLEFAPQEVVQSVDIVSVKAAPSELTKQLLDRNGWLMK